METGELGMRNNRIANADNLKRAEKWVAGRGCGVIEGFLFKILVLE